MSCVGFFTSEQLRRVREAAADPRPVSTFASPDVTPAKVARVKAMADSGDPRIRESAALSYIARADVLQQLSSDADPGVRGWVAANPGVPDGVLDDLALDDDVTVQAVVEWARGWD